MCGIMAVALTEGEVSSLLIEGLQALEYRGYDSAGVAIRKTNGELSDLKVVGKVRQLRHELITHPISGQSGIGHTRWATHGKVAEINAHPHSAGDDLFVVHNGIIENYEVLRNELIEQDGYTFESQTDSEVLTKLIHRERAKNNGDLAKALRSAMQLVAGSYSLVALQGDSPKLYGALHGCPLVLGMADGEVYLASDLAALVGRATEFCQLRDGDIALVGTKEQSILAADTTFRELSFAPIPEDKYTSGKGDYQHFIEKEMHDIPEVISETLSGVLTSKHVVPQSLGSVSQQLADIQEIHLVACGSAYFACNIGAHWLREHAGIPAQAFIASEFRYQSPRPRPKTLLIAVSQSGETADTLGALAEAKNYGYFSTLAVCNVSWSAIREKADHLMLTRAGREISVLSTKATVAQALSLLLISLSLREIQGEHTDGLKDIIASLFELNQRIEDVLEDSFQAQLKAWATALADAKKVFFLGRGAQHTAALEGALKLKEGAYIHAEAYPAGELKHGPLALIEPGVQIVATLPNDPHLASKTLSNLSEVKARGGHVYILTPQAIAAQCPKDTEVITLPNTHPTLTVIPQIVAVQLLAYHTALMKGTDIDQPRNLAKSVTVE